MPHFHDYQNNEFNGNNGKKPQNLLPEMQPACKGEGTGACVYLYYTSS